LPAGNPRDRAICKEKFPMAAPLAGIRVIELGTMISAALTGMMLADLGATVIKVERRDGGDPFRSFRGGLYGPHFTAYNRGKQSLTLDLSRPEGLAILQRLLAGGDVLLENFRPGVMARLGLDETALDRINPRLIHASITGFGADGPYAERPAFDTVGLALSGIASLYVDGTRPDVSGPTISDNVTGMYACHGIVAALYGRLAGASGRRVEVSMLEASIGFIPDPFASQDQLGIEQTPWSRVSASQSYTLACADGHMLALHLSSFEKFWQGLTASIERPDLAADPRFASRADRVTHYLELREVLGEVFRTRSRDTWLPILEANDVPHAPVNRVSEVESDPQVQHLGLFHRVDHPEGGTMRAMHRPVLIDGKREPDTGRAPLLGEHSETILAQAGYSPAQIAGFRQSAIV
jgi:formyl-CoA transferase